MRINASNPRCHKGGLLHGVDGLKAGLKEFGFEEGKQYMIEAHDLNGDTNAAFLETNLSTCLKLQKVSGLRG
jgi:hypothetical protein